MRGRRDTSYKGGGEEDEGQWSGKFPPRAKNRVSNILRHQNKTFGGEGMRSLSEEGMPFAPSLGGEVDQERILSWWR